MGGLQSVNQTPLNTEADDNNWLFLIFKILIKNLSFVFYFILIDIKPVVS